MSKVGPILALVGVFLLARGATVAGIVLLVIGLGKLFRVAGDPRRKLRQTILHDAARHGCRVPPDESVWASLETVYVKYGKTRAAYPQLEPTYTDLVESMWTELRSTTLLSEWRRIVRMVAQDWPTPWGEGESPLKTSMRRAQQASARWRDARREAMGEIPV